jgi:hypothetical protein
MKERKDSPDSLPSTGSLASLLHPAVPEMKSFCGGTKMDDLQGPEVEAILLHVAYHHHTLYECAVEESLVGLSKMSSGSVNVISFSNTKIIFLKNRENI